MAITSPILRSTSITKKKVSESRQSIKNIGNILFRKVKVKREIFNQTNFLRQRRVETERRKQVEDEMQAPRVVTQPRGPQQITEQSTTGGFFDRILGFVGYLAAGWLMNNLPTWIGIGKEFVARLTKAGQIISTFFNDTIKIFSGVGNLLGAVGQDLISFDFFDTSNRIKNAMSGLNLTVGDIGKQIEEAYGLLTTPLTEGKYSGKNIPGLGTEQTNEGAYGEPAPYTGSGGGGGRWKPLLDLISSVESSTDRQNSGYDAQNGAPGGVKPGLSQMTIGEIARSAPGASGRYQQMPQYLLARAKSAGYNENTVFSREVQDVLAIKLIEGRGGNAWLAGKMSTEQFMQGLSQEWAALPNAYGGFAYRGQSSSLRPENVKSVLEQVKSGSSQSQIEQVPAGNVNPTVTSRYGAQRGARTHGGTDLAVNSGTPLRAVSDGVIVDSDFEKGWGNFLVMKDNLGIYHLYGHMQSGYKRGGPVKKGEVIGKVGTTGNTTGPHLHWEAGTGWNGGTITGKFDPLNKYSKFAPFNTSSGISTTSATPAQISAPTEQQRQMVPFNITPERRGQNIIIAEQPRNQQNIMISSGGGESQMPIQIDEADLLNTFIKKKLLLDLAYL